jgi:hypothetical protein
MVSTTRSKTNVHQQPPQQPPAPPAAAVSTTTTTEGAKESTSAVPVAAACKTADVSMPWQLKMLKKGAIDSMSVSGLLLIMYSAGKLFEKELNHYFLDNSATVLIFSFIMPLCVFVVYGLILFAVDMYASPQYKASAKIQPYYQPTLSDYGKATKVAAFNWLVMGLPFSVFVCFCLTPLRSKYINWQMRADQNTLVSSIPEFLLSVAFFAIVEEIMFYYSHRWLHTKGMYASVHKVRFDFSSYEDDDRFQGVVLCYFSSIINSPRHLESQLYTLFLSSIS